MQLINTKINYELGDTKVYTTELNNNDYSIDIHIKEDNLKATINTNKDLHNLKIDFYIKINFNYSEFISNGYQTWIPSQKFNQNDKKCKYKNKIISKITKGTGLDYIGEYNTPYDKETSFGLCYLKKKNSNDILLFSSLDEMQTFTKYTFDFERHILKISREFYGYSINKTMEIANIVAFESDFTSAFLQLKDILLKNAYKLNNVNKNFYESNQKQTLDGLIKNEPIAIKNFNIQNNHNKNNNVNERIIGYNTFCEYQSNIGAQIINNKIYTLDKAYNVFFIGDGYSEKSPDIFNTSDKRFPSGIKPLVDNIHAKGIKAGIWVAPFAIAPLSQSFSKYSDIVLKQNNKQIVTCPFWNGAYSIDITLQKSQDYLNNMFEVIIKDWGFDIIYCDCIYLAGSIPTAGKTQAMLINDGINIIKKLVGDKTLILGGVPFLSAIGNCDYISISSDSKKVWQCPLDFLSPQMPMSSKSNVKNLVLKKYMDLLYPCIYTIPSSKKIKTKLVNNIVHNFSNIITSDRHIIPTTYPSQLKLD